MIRCDLTGSLIRFGRGELQINPRPNVTPIAANEIIRAYASAASKVLPIANSATRNTGRLRINEDVSGRMYARSSSPKRLLSQDSDGPYESENRKAAPASERAIPELRWGKLRRRIGGT